MKSINQKNKKKCNKKILNSFTITTKSCLMIILKLYLILNINQFMENVSKY